MELLACLLMLPTFIEMDTWQWDGQSTKIHFTLHSTQASPCCPICQTPSQRIHSHYERTIRDLPLSQYGVSWQLKVRKCFCRNDNCPRRIFTERFAELLQPWGRKTLRLIDHLKSIGLALAGVAGEQLAKALNIQASRETILRLVRGLSLPIITTPRVLGVDDWAYRRGRQYGTILVDLETHKPIALLPDRKASTLAQWLQEHPGVEIISRDRSLAYKQGASDGAPDAIQVADRFHLLENLAEALEKTFRSYVRELKEVEAIVLQQTQLVSGQTVDIVAVPAPAPEPDDILHAQQARQRRLENYQQTWALHDQGLSAVQIAQQAGISERSVHRYLKESAFPERQRRNDRGKSILDPFKPYILQRWNQGVRDGRQLYEEVKVLGYEHSYNVVSAYLRCLKQVQPLQPSAPVQCIESDYLPLTARRATWLVLSHEEQRDDEGYQVLNDLKQYSPIFEEAITLVQEFTQMLRGQIPEALDGWLKRATEGNLSALASFAEGLIDDYDAVKAGLTLEWSNGPVEGLINRLKTLKRQMYGRADLDLLSKRFILTS